MTERWEKLEQLLILHLESKRREVIADGTFSELFSHISRLVQIMTCRGTNNELERQQGRDGLASQLHLILLIWKGASMLNSAIQSTT